MRRKDDILLKGAFEEAFPDLLRFFFEEADTYFDLERGFEFLDKELGELFPEVATKGGTRLADMLVKVFLKDGSDKWILIHLEMQGVITTDFPHRMYTYYYRIYDRYGVNIIALAIYTGSKDQRCPNTFCKEYFGTEIRYRYNVYHILDHDEKVLLSMNNPFSLIVLAAQKALLSGKIPEVELGEHRLTVARALLKSQKYSHEQIIRFLHFLKNFVYIADPEINCNFDRQVELLTGKENAMGIIEAIKEVTREETWREAEEKFRERETEFVKSLLLNTDFSTTRIAMLAGISDSFVKKVAEELGQ